MLKKLVPVLGAVLIAGSALTVSVPSFANTSASSSESSSSTSTKHHHKKKSTSSTSSSSSG